VLFVFAAWYVILCVLNNVIATSKGAGPVPVEAPSRQRKSSFISVYMIGLQPDMSGCVLCILYTLFKPRDRWRVSSSALIYIYMSFFYVIIFITYSEYLKLLELFWRYACIA